MLDILREYSVVYSCFFLCAEDIIANESIKFNKTDVTVQRGIRLNCYTLEFLYVSFRTDMTGYDTGDPGEEQGER